LSPLRTNEKAIKEVNKLLYTFLWNEKGDKIKRDIMDIMINDYSNGGLKMIDIQSFNKSLKATWIKKNWKKGNGNFFLMKSSRNMEAYTLHE